MEFADLENFPIELNADSVCFDFSLSKGAILTLNSPCCLSFHDFALGLGRFHCPQWRRRESNRTFTLERYSGVLLYLQWRGMVSDSDGGECW